MRIVDIECTHVTIPKTSSNVIGGRDDYEGIPYRDEDVNQIGSYVNEVPHFGNALSCIVKIYTDEGIVGIAEGHSHQKCEIERIKGNILGCDVYDVSRISNALIFGRGSSPRSVPNKSVIPGTKEMATIETALWDCIAKKAGVPVYKLMGGAVREHVPITLFLGDRPIDECIEAIGIAVAEGIGTIKLKTGCNDKRDVDLLREIRREFGYDLILRIDSNAAWDVVEAIRVLKRMEPYNLQYAEGMLRQCESGYSFRRLREATGIPMCICEQFPGYHEMSAEEALIHTVDLIRMNACDVLSLDPMRTGGILGFNQVCALCEGAGIQVVTHRANTSLSGAIWLTCCMINYATELAQDIVPVGQPSAPKYDTVFETLKHENGFMKPLDGPGWGMTLNEEILQKYEKVSRSHFD